MDGRWNEVLDVGKSLAEDFRKTTGYIPSSDRGILPSEAFFILVTSHPFRPVKIIESGRAQGQSTFLLGKIFTDSKIISIEYDKDNPDAQIALEKLAELTNVQCLFGNSMEIIPKIFTDNDILVIDGPKDMKALMLTAIVSRRYKPRFVYIHDAYKGSILRNYLERSRFKCLYSDEPKFIQSFCFLDESKDKKDIEFWSTPQNYPNDKIYGGTFACLETSSLRFSQVEMIKIAMVKLKYNLEMSFKKRFNQGYQIKHPCE